MRYKKLVVVLAIILISVPLAFAADLIPGEEPQPTIIVQYQGSRAIADSLASKSAGEKNSILSAATDTVLKDVKYPYTIEKTEITILKYRCDKDMQVCGYWITATRGGREVYTNSPIWISPPPYEVVVSTVHDEKAFVDTVTIREDPKTAAEDVLKRILRQATSRQGGIV